MDVLVSRRRREAPLRKALLSFGVGALVGFLAAPYLTFEALRALSSKVVYGGSSPRVELHYSPKEDLDAIDAALIGSSRREIDASSYILTDHAVIAALADAVHRGVKLRLVLDPHEQHSPGVFATLPADSIRFDTSGAPYLLTSYEIDRKALRTGAANAAKPGETAQANDLVVIEDPMFVSRFEIEFEQAWKRGTPEP
jgi:hypothetical protein